MAVLYKKNIFVFVFITLWTCIAYPFEAPKSDKLVSQETKIIKSYDPQNLVTAYRFDLMAKYLYARSRELGIESSWPLEVYAEHLRTWGNFTEIGNKDKKGLPAFLKIFHEILDSIKTGGFDHRKSLVPVAPRHITNGAHRVSACLLYNKPVFGYDVPGKNRKGCTAEFFREKTSITPNGLSDEYLDAMALQFCELKKNTYIATLFPCVTWSDDYITKVFEKYGTIVYKKTCTLSKNAPLNLLRVLYHRKTACYTTEKRFNDGTDSFNVRIVLFQCKDLDTVKKLKSEVRAHFNIGNYPIHINDYYEETLEYAQTFFVHNSLKFLTEANFKTLKHFDQFLSDFSRVLRKYAIPSEFVCIDGSAVMAAYGIRDCKDLDFILYGFSELEGKNLGHTSIHVHNNQLKFYPFSKDELIFNPRHHFYYQGFKFVTLEVLKSMKLTRNEKKDQNDVALINTFIKHNA